METLEDLKDKIGELLVKEEERNEFWLKIREKLDKSIFFGEKNVFYENEQVTIRILREEEEKGWRKREEEKRRDEAEMKR